MGLSPPKATWFTTQVQGRSPSPGHHCSRSWHPLVPLFLQPTCRGSRSCTLTLLRSTCTLSSGPSMAVPGHPPRRPPMASVPISALRARTWGQSHPLRNWTRARAQGLGLLRPPLPSARSPGPRGPLCCAWPVFAPSSRDLGLVACFSVKSLGSEHVERRLWAGLRGLEGWAPAGPRPLW